MAATAKKKTGVREHIAERRTKVWELRKAGLSVRKIAAALGDSPATVGKDILAVLKELREQQLSDAEQWRALDVEQTELALFAINKLVSTGHLGAIDRWNRLLDHRARILGYAAQPDTVTSVPVTITLQSVPARGQTEAEPFQGEEE